MPFAHRQVSSVLVAALLALAAACPLSAAEPLIAKFDEAKRPEKWTVNFGHWEPQDGVLVCRQLDKDNHAAASRWQIPLKDAVIKLRLKFDGATGFHLGFDPAPGEIKKEGHLYSLVVTPTQAQIKKHKDKADEASKDQTLATASLNAKAGEWLDIELRTVGLATENVESLASSLAVLPIVAVTFSPSVRSSMSSHSPALALSDAVASV